MNIIKKIKLAAYMFLTGAALSLSGCAEKGGTQMYLEAKVQDGQAGQDLETPPGQEQGQKQKDADTETETASGSEDPTQSEKDDGQGTCFVYVCGAVNHPGVFELPEGSRVYEAIALAGGLCKDAYAKGVNQARQIEDGDMIEILTVKEQRELEKEPQVAAASEAAQDGRAGSHTAAAQDGQSGSHTAAAQDGRIDINTATAQQLMELSGIGEAKAANIIAYRESNGGFSAPEDIMNVSGIGEGVYARIKDKIKVAQ